MYSHLLCGRLSDIKQIIYKIYIHMQYHMYNQKDIQKMKPGNKNYLIYFQDLQSSICNRFRINLKVERRPNISQYISVCSLSKYMFVLFYSSFCVSYWFRWTHRSHFSFKPTNIAFKMSSYEYWSLKYRGGVGFLRSATIIFLLN